MRRLISSRRFLAKTYTDFSLVPSPQALQLQSDHKEQNTSSTNNQENLKLASDTEPQMKVPYSSVFAGLKSEEQKQFYFRKRIRFNFNQNYSAALALPYSKVELERNQQDKNALLDLSRDHVIEHANRRVDLYFYTLIAYYKTMIVPTTGHTNLQHGKGRNIKGSINITQACHSSFTPALLDITIFQNRKRGVKHKSLLSGTHFMNNLNSTVELPSFINELDIVLENSCRQPCMEILGGVSSGTINPINGLTIFLNMMQNIITELKQQSERRGRSGLLPHSLMKQPEINTKLLDLVERGTLLTTFLTETQVASDEYIQLLLRMTPDEIALCESNIENKEQLYLDKIMEIQNEILQTKSSLNIS